MDVTANLSATSDNIFMWLTFGVIIYAMVSYVLEKVSFEITSLIVLGLLLMLTYIGGLVGLEEQVKFNASDILAGFGNTALITIIALMVMAQGLFQSGAIETITNRLVTMASRSPFFAVLVILLIAMVSSAFLNNTPVVLMSIPILTAIAAQAGFAAPRMMMPLSFICILGGMTTLIGSSTNLLVAGVVLESEVMAPLGFFSFTIPGLFLAIIGGAYVLLFMPYLLRNIDAGENPQPNQSGKQYIVEVRLRGDSSLIGAQPVAGFFPELEGMTLRMVERYGKEMLPPFEDCTLQVGDILIIAATRRQLTEALSMPDHPLAHFVPESFITSTDAAKSEDDHPTLAEVVVAPGSRMNMRTIYQSGFPFETGCRVLGVQRRSHMGRQNFHNIRLAAGDVLLLLGTRQQIQALRDSRDVLLLEWSAENLPNFAYANRARFIFAGMVALAAFNILPMVMAAFLGAVAMLLSGALNIRQAMRGVDLRVFLTIVAALAMSTAMTATGGAAYLGGHFVTLLEGAPMWVTLSAFFLLCAAVTNILSNNATAVLFAPIAFVLAQRLGVAPEAFVFAVIFAANCSFVTPIAYQTNLLVMTPGNYQSKDFIKIGFPLLILLWLAYSIFAPYYFGL